MLEGKASFWKTLRENFYLFYSWNSVYRLGLFTSVTQHLQSPQWGRNFSSPFFSDSLSRRLQTLKLTPCARRRAPSLAVSMLVSVIERLSHHMETSEGRCAPPNWVFLSLSLSVSSFESQSFFFLLLTFLPCLGLSGWGLPLLLRLTLPNHTRNAIFSHFFEMSWGSFSFLLLLL